MFWKVFWAFFRTGLLGFGGGAAIAPAMHREVVERYGWVDGPTFNDVLALSNTLPGPSAPQMAAAIGYRASGLSGAIAAVTALIVPTAIAVVFIITWIFSTVGQSSERLLVLRRATIGIFPLVSAMICTLIAKFYKQGKASLGGWRTIFIAALFFVLIDDNTYGVFHMPFGIDNSFVILTMIYLTLTMASPFGRRHKLIFSIPAVAFLFIHSQIYAKMSFTHTAVSSWILALIMVAVATLAALRTPPLDDVDEDTSTSIKPVLKDIGKMWAVVLPLGIILCAISPLLGNSVYLGLLGGMVFTGLMTFGGGPVFIPLAIDLLAGPKSQIFLYSQERFMQYLAIINSLPSPIITKTSAIAGFDMVRDLAGYTGYSLGENGITSLGISTPPHMITLWAICGGLLMVIAMTLPAVSNSLLAFSSLSKLRRSRGMRAMSSYIITVLIAIFVSVILNFMGSSITTIASFPCMTMAQGIMHTVLLFCVLYGMQRMKRKLPGFVTIGLVVIYGLIFL